MLKGRQFSAYTVYIQCLDHRDELVRLTLDHDENNRSQCFNHRDEIDSTVQIGCGMHTVHVLHA